MVAFWGNTKRVEASMQKFSDAVGKCLHYSLHAIMEYVAAGEDNEKVQHYFNEAHRAESKADGYRRSIIRQLLEGDLMPNTRADLIRLLENMDDIADEAEDMIDYAVMPALDLSAIEPAELQELVDMLQDQYKVLQKAVSHVFDDLQKAFDESTRLEELDRENDKKKDQLIRQFCRATKSTSKKIVTREVIFRIGQLSSEMENVGDIIEEMIVVRRG